MMAVNDRGYDVDPIDRGGGKFELRPVKALLPVNEKATAYYHARCLERRKIERSATSKAKLN